MKIHSQLRKYNLNASHKLVGIKKDTNEQGERPTMVEVDDANTTPKQRVRNTQW